MSMLEHVVNKLDNFIMGWYANPEEISICDDIIEYWKSFPSKYQGTVYNQKETDGSIVTDKEVNLEIKNSVEAPLCTGELHKKYIIEFLQLRVNAYIKKYPWCNGQVPWTVIEGINVQYYPPSGGFYKWHAERTNSHHPNCSRHLVFMTYLNTVTDAGETEFYHQNVKIKPEKGLTLIWPADWVFTHRGIPSPSQDKYIVTGWFNYV